EILAANISQQAVNQENVNILQIKEKEGANTAASDLTDFVGQLASSKVAVVSAQNSLDAAKLSLYQLLNIPYNPNAKYSPLNAEELSSQYGANPDDIYATALKQFPAIKAAELHRQSFEKGV